MLDHVLSYIAPGPVPLPLANRHRSSLKGREILVDLVDLLLDVLGVDLEIHGHGWSALNRCAFRCARKSPKV
jgi:hypothetical protein